MLQGQVTFGKQEEVIFGQPAAEAAAMLAKKYGARRVLIMASATLNRETDVVANVAAALGDRALGVFDAMPAHTPREAVIAATAMAREGGADMIATVGGGSVTDGAKAVSLCLANDIADAASMDALRAPNPVKAPTVRQVSVPTTLSAGEFSALCGVTDERTRAKELFTHPLIIPRATVLDPDAAAAVIRMSLNLIRLYAVISRPFIPDASDQMLAALNLPATESWPETAEAALAALPAGHAFATPGVLFAKIADDRREELEARFAGA